MPKLSEDYRSGFLKACKLHLGTNMKWTRAEIALRNRATRELFGRKRPKTTGRIRRPNAVAGFNE